MVSQGAVLSSSQPGPCAVLLRAPPGPKVQGQCRRKRHGTHLEGWHSFTGWHAWVERMVEARAGDLVESDDCSVPSAQTSPNALRAHARTVQTYARGIPRNHACTPTRATQHRQARTLNAPPPARTHARTRMHTHTCIHTPTTHTVGKCKLSSAACAGAEGRRGGGAEGRVSCVCAFAAYGV